MTTLSWKQVMPLWWSFFWRATLFGLLLGFGLGAVGGVIAALAGVPDQSGLYGALGGWVASIPATIVALKYAVSKHLMKGVLRGS